MSNTTIVDIGANNTTALTVDGAMTEEDEYQLLAWRIVILVLTVITGFCFFIPFCKLCQKYEGKVTSVEDKMLTYTCKNRCIQFMNCFAGGALLALSLCHILPETQKEYAQYMKRNGENSVISDNFPFVPFLILMGFILTLCLDQVLYKPAWKAVKDSVDRQKAYEIGKELDAQETAGGGSQDRRQSVSSQRNRSESQIKKQSPTQSLDKVVVNGGHDSVQEGGEPLDATLKTRRIDNQIYEGQIGETPDEDDDLEGGSNQGAAVAVDDIKIQDEGAKGPEENPTSEEQQLDTERPMVSDGNGKTPTPEEWEVMPAPEIIAPQSLFLFALLFVLHSFIAGLTIGAFKDVKEIGLIACIVIVWRIPISLSFGVLFLSAGRKCWSVYTIIFGILFIAATPLGIWMMFAEGDEAIRKIDPTILVIQGFVCGSLIYIACGDLIAKEFQASNDINPNDEADDDTKMWQQKVISLIKWIFVFFGVLFVLVMFTVGGQDLTNPHGQFKEYAGEHIKAVEIPDVKKLPVVGN